MTEKKLILQLKKLKKVQPSQDWVVLTKNTIFNKQDQDHVQEKHTNLISGLINTIIKDFQIGEKFVFQHKMAFASVLTITVFVGLFGFAQNSVPGDSLFAIKKIAEQSQAVFITENYKSIHDLEIAGKRLDDLTKAAQNNNVEKVEPALIEYEQTISKAAQTLGQAESMKEVALEIRKLQEKENAVRSLGIEIDCNKDLDNALKIIIEREIKNLKSRELNEAQTVDLAEIEADFDQEKYSQALEKILLFEK